MIVTIDFETTGFKAGNGRNLAHVQATTDMSLRHIIL